MAILVLTLLFLLGTSRAQAQVSEVLQGETTSKVEAASKADLEKAAAQTRAALRKMRQQQEEQLAAIRRQSEQAAEAQKKRDLELKAQLKASAREEATERALAFYRTQKFYGVAAGVLVLVLVCLVLVIARKPRRTVKVVRVPEDLPMKDDDLEDPKAEDLKKYSRANANVNPVPFVLPLEKDGERPLCEATLREGLDPLITKVDGKILAQPIAWAKRKTKVSEYLKRVA